MAGFLLLGACQRTTSLEVMRPLHDKQNELQSRLAALRADGSCDGAMLLATCNRFEVVIELGDADPDLLRERLFSDFDVPLQTKRDTEVVLHLVQVATGLRSLVVGEDQILGQLAQAFRDSEAQGLCGKRLRMLYSRVVRAARRMRQARPAVSSPRSVAELAARIARETGPRVAILGAGTTAQTAAESLRDRGASSLWFFNRTVQNAERLARHFDAHAGSLDDLMLSPPDVDAVIVAISGRTVRVPVERMPSLRTVVDISQPAVAELPEGHDVRHLDLDGLALLQQEKEELMEVWCHQSETQARHDAERIWDEIENGRVDLGQLLHQHVENATDEVDRALRGKLRALDPAVADEVRRLAERVARRNAHLHLSDVRHFARA